MIQQYRVIHPTICLFLFYALCDNDEVDFSMLIFMLYLVIVAFQVFFKRFEAIICFFFVLFCFLIYLFYFYFWLCWVFVAARGLSLVAASGDYSVAVHGLLIAVASLVAEHRL